MTLSFDKKLKKNEKTLKVKKNIKKSSPPKELSSFSYGEAFLSSLKTRYDDPPLKTFHLSTSDKKKEICDFYIELLRKLELVKFSSNNKINNNSKNLKVSEISCYFYKNHYFSR